MGRKGGWGGHGMGRTWDGEDMGWGGDEKAGDEEGRSGLL